jgi:hypothetical protein
MSDLGGRDRGLANLLFRQIIPHSLGAMPEYSSPLSSQPRGLSTFYGPTSGPTKSLRSKTAL